MSTAPQGWQTPKTNWQGADIVHPSDLNRIESNIQAIESGSRTLDSSQAPSGNTGSLRQLLDWFANRLKAITGAANWYDAPATTLAATKSHIDATSGIHGATSSTTANRIIIRDSAGRAKVAAPSAPDDIARKDTVDAHANATSVHGATSSATANRIIIRDSAGRAKVAPPQANDDIATKKYVDDRIGAAVVVLTGMISDDGTLPIPSGFTEQQCKFFVSIHELNTTGTALKDSRFGARLIGRQVWCRWVNVDGSASVRGTANYMVIGVK